MEKYLIALDMDGTLLDSQGKITKRTIEVLKELIQKGHYIVPASGRALTLLPKRNFGVRRNTVCCFRKWSCCMGLEKSMRNRTRVASERHCKSDT